MSSYEKVKEWRLRNPGARAEEARRWRAKHPEIKSRYREKHRDRILPIEAVYDHWHTSGVFRGWICDRCNKTLGLVKDNPTILYKMATYLELFNGETNYREEEESTELIVRWARPLVPSK